MEISLTRATREQTIFYKSSNSRKGITSTQQQL